MCPAGGSESLDLWGLGRCGSVSASLGAVIPRRIPPFCALTKRFQSGPNKITGKQKYSTFLLPIQTDLAAY